jgi:hypothetical protein
VLALATWRRRQQLGGSVACSAVVVAAEWGRRQRCRHCCHATATCHCGGDKDTGGNSNGGGTDNNQQSAKSIGSNGDRNSDYDSDKNNYESQWHLRRQLGGSAATAVVEVWRQWWR